MKTKSKNISSFYQRLLMSLIIILFINVTYAQVSVKPLENSVQKVISSYYEEPFNITADSKGEVTISGSVQTLFDKLKIGELISEVDNVSGVNNKLEVIVDQPTADGIIKANIENEFQLNNAILEPEKIKVNVKDGIVNLSGTVSYFREKLMAQSIASWQDGVIDMTSSIKLLPPSSAVSDQNIKALINDIRNKHFSIEKDVKFDIHNGLVKLYGSAKSLYAINHFQEEIQHLLGVKDVINNLTLERL
jgi:osmotically-inducible protein OsmY